MSETSVTQPTSRCPICSTSATLTPESRPDDVYFTVQCPRCGTFAISGQMEAVLQKRPLSGRPLANASGWMRQNPGMTLTIADDNQLRLLRTPTVAERGEFLLRHLAVKHPGAGLDIRINVLTVELLAITWSEAVNEVYFIAWEFLGKEKGYLSPDPGSTHTWGNMTSISPGGWSFLESLGANPSSELGFVAMSFVPELYGTYRDAISPAITAAGYKAIRADEHRHEGLVDAEIHALIRRSRFLVTDFTGQNNGVYYEAGFARGLGHRVFRICREDQAAAVHFDQNHYHVLRWTPDALPELARELRARIEEDLGRGPLARSS